MSGNSAPVPESTSYILGRTNAEYERLRRQARCWEKATKSVLEQAGLEAGMRCLDAGCGPGEVMRLMAEAVGPTGCVVGVDLNGELGNEAIRVLKTQGLVQCSFTQADIRTMEQPAEAPFDLIFARLLLYHLSEPSYTLARLYGWLKPGGSLVIQDYDTEAVKAQPDWEPLREFKVVWSGVCARHGLDESIGFLIPELFASAGIGLPDATDVSGLFLPFSSSCQMLAGVYRSVLPLALKYGLTTTERSDRFLQQMENAPAQTGYLLWPLLVSAWKRKPRQSET
jgi:SAM-dependent methyltransferase